MSPESLASDDAPIRNFSDCHSSIVTNLNALSRLPALAEAAREARQIAADALEFFRQVVCEHHAEEERELFPAVLASAAKGEERHQIELVVERLTAEHRAIERDWAALEPGLKAVARGSDGAPDADALAALVERYLAHARYEETDFLPLSREILGRNSNHMAALGLSLHLRHAVPELLKTAGCARRPRN